LDRVGLGPGNMALGCTLVLALALSISALLPCRGFLLPAQLGGLRTHPRVTGTLCATGFLPPCRGRKRGSDGRALHVRACSEEVEGSRVAMANEFLRERGIFGSDNVEIGPCGALGMGLVAKRPISGNQEVVVEVPPSMMITEDTAMEGTGEAGMLLKAMLQDLMGFQPQSAVELGDALIALRLMYERAAGDASALFPYVRMLPESLDMPLFWPQAERERLLKGCLILEDTQALEETITGQYDFINDMVLGMFPEKFPEEFFSLEQYRFHVCLSISRAFSLDGMKGLGRGLALLPGIDMANHDDGVKFAVQRGDGVFSGRDSIVLISDRDYAEGEQVFTTYGRKSNAQSLYAFGFTREDPMHPFNSADIALQLDASDPLRQMKAQVLTANGIYSRMRFQVPVSQELIAEGLSRKAPASTQSEKMEGGPLGMTEQLVDSWAQVLPFLRMLSLGGDGASELLSGDPQEAWLRMWTPLEGSLEDDAVDALIKHFDGMLQVLEEDVAPAARAGLTERERVSAVVRASEAAALREGRAALSALKTGTS